MSLLKKDIKKININELKNISGVYIIKCLSNDKIYVGSTIDVRRRIFDEHLFLLKNNKHYNKKLQNAWNKYGESTFEINIIEVVYDNRKLIEREQYYLDTLLFANYNDDRFEKLGYNICRRADWAIGNKNAIGGRSEEFKLSMSNLMKDYYSKNPNKKRNKKVLQYDTNGNFIKEWNPTKEICEHLNVHISIIYACCNDKNKIYESIDGYVLKYK